MTYVPNKWIKYVLTESQVKGKELNIYDKFKKQRRREIAKYTFDQKHFIFLVKLEWQFLEYDKFFHNSSYLGIYFSFSHTCGVYVGKRDLL